MLANRGLNPNIKRQTTVDNSAVVARDKIKMNVFEDDDDHLSQHEFKPMIKAERGKTDKFKADNFDFDN